MTDITSLNDDELAQVTYEGLVERLRSVPGVTVVMDPTPHVFSLSRNADRAGAERARRHRREAVVPANACDLTARECANGCPTRAIRGRTGSPERDRDCWHRRIEAGDESGSLIG